MYVRKDHPMSKHINMTGHYKVAGRDRQGEGILQSSQKGAFAQQRHEARLQALESQAGPPAWETTPPNLEIADRPKPRTRKQTTKPKTPRKAPSTRIETRSTRNRKATRKAAPRAKAAPRKTAPRRKAARSSSRSAR
jgi:hypothetical protein